ncbi:MAG TPA: hypothetical protein VIW67_07085 [Terriglobales bacterium]|jgi:hypothetical protein
MATAKKSTLAQLLAKQPRASFVQTETVGSAPMTPFFDHVIEGASGTESFEELLTRMTGPVDPQAIPQFPTAACLTPEQIYNFDAVEQKQQAHLAECPWCKNMMAAAQPTEEEFKDICRKAKSAANAQRKREVAAY